MKCSRGFTLFSLTTGLLVLSAMFFPVSVSQNPVDKVNGTPVGWSDDILLADTPPWDTLCSIENYGDNIYVVWQHAYKLNSPGVDHQIVYVKSADGGITWSPYKNVSSEIAQNNDPEISIHENNIHVIWSTINEIDGIDRCYYRFSTDGAETWNDVKQINEETGNNAAGSQIFTNDSNVHIIWLDGRNGASEVYYRRSLDGGITFDNGQGVDEDRRLTFSPSTISGPLVIDGDGNNISVAWPDERDGDWEIYWMISKDNGFTWEDGLGNVGQDRRISQLGVESFHPALAINGSTIHIVWVDMEWPGPVYKLYYQNSTDNGLTWSNTQQLTGPVSIIDHPHIEVDGDNVHVVWSDRRVSPDAIYYKNSTDGGITWSSDLRLTYNLTRTAGRPGLSLYNEKKHLVWTDANPGIDHNVLYKRYPDFPDLSPPSHTNETPPPDSYKDAPGTNISVHVTDLSGVNASTIQLWVNGSLVSHTSTSITDGFNVSYISPGFSPGVVECRIVADDNLSNHLDFTWNFTVLALYEIQLHEGWNLISVPHVQIDTSINEVLRDIDGKWDYIQWYDASDPVDKWKTNATFKPQQLNYLFYLNRTMAFWINITEPDVNLTVRGLRSTYTEIPLYAGWNLVGYSTQTTETVANALWGTGADRVEVFNATAPYRIKEVGPTYIMKPGEGYWVHVPADTVWTINW